MRLLLFPLLLPLLSACTGEKPPPPDTGGPVECETSIWHLDLDGDGYGDPDATVEACEPPEGEIADGTDCDDTDADVHPGAEEDCATDVDANCDGSIGFVDADADGYAACEECDDANPAVHPGAAEFCDGVDSDCDDVVDDEPVNGVIWYTDADGDGYGDVASATRACDQPADGVSDFTDCDDTSSAISPAADEVCDSVDNDCDGSVDESDAADGSTWYLDEDGDGFGDDATLASGCEAPADGVAVGGDCDDLDTTINPDATEVCDGVDNDCDATIDGAGASDVRTWYIDRDTDGYGDAAYPDVACTQPRGYVADDTDCDDTDADSSPSASESCDGEDDDCDGVVDEDDAVDAVTWYVDGDGDGYGDPALGSPACTAPTGSVARGTDCDDTTAAISPAATETCDGIDDDCDGTTDEDDAAGAPTWYADTDGDGFGDPAVTHAACTLPSGWSGDATDCDDGDATISPDGTETCDGADDDCDGVVDEDDASGAPTWYADADADGYGDAATSHAACAAPTGYLADATDCDDGDPAFHPGAAESDCADPNDYNCDGSVGEADADADGYVACDDCDDAAATVHPGAPEDCNGVDDDCDGTVDGATAVGAGTWYADTDGDGFGDPGAIDHSCDMPAGYTTDATDCDDDDAAVSPAADELCSTAVDDDCDGAVNEARAADCSRYYLDFDGDTYGSTSSLCACEATDLFTSASNDDCDDGDATVHPGATEVWGNFVDDDCDGAADAIAMDSADAILDGEGASEFAGVVVGPAGDVDGDGFDDLLVGAYGNGRGGADAGAAYIVRGPVSGEVSLADADTIFVGEAAGDHAGFGLAGDADVDGDGNPDVLVGSYLNGAGGNDAGTAYLGYGPLTGEVDLSTMDALIVGDDRSDYAGWSVAFAGDSDDDGFDDILVGAPQDDNGRTTNSGSVYFFRGPITGSYLTSDADVQLYGDSSNDAVGRDMAPVGDTNGDGYDDFLVGVGPDDDNGSGSGSAYLIDGPLTAGGALRSVCDAELTGESSSDEAGAAVAGPGDVDGDGYDDLLIGAPSASTGGRAYLVTSSVSGVMTLADADTIFSGAASGDEAGGSVAGIGDFDGDGNRDLLIGAYGNDDGGTGAGIAYVIFDTSPGNVDLDDTAQLLGDANDAVGVSVAGPGDVDGDGRSDLLVGGYEDDNVGDSAGAAWLLLGR